MKKFWILGALVFFYACKTQVNCPAAYLKAYNHLAKVYNQSNLKIETEETSVGFISFFEELAEGDIYQVIFKLDSVNNLLRNQPNTLLNINCLPSSTSSKYRVFFSDFYDELLMAEVFQNEGLDELGYEDLVKYNKSEIFLFVFKEGRLSQVFRKWLQYD